MAALDRTIPFPVWERCEHNRDTAPRRRIRSNGAIVWVLQCLVCGGEVRAIARNAPERRFITEIVEFDEGLADRYQKARAERHRHAMAARDAQIADEAEAQQRAWWVWYDGYLETVEWQRKRDAVLERASGRCEGCRINRASHVHHLTYDHAGDEFLFELVALCEMCHGRLHPHLGVGYGQSDP